MSSRDHNLTVILKLKYMKISLTPLFIVIACLFSINNQAQNSVTSADLEPLLGEWKGTLTYVDYSSNKPYTMPAYLTASQGKSENQVSLMYRYPNEPKANSKGKIKISDQGKKLNNESVISREVLADGSVQITTSYNGKDNNKEAIMKGVYILGKTICVIRKEVKYVNSDKWLKRNEYSFQR